MPSEANRQLTRAPARMDQQASVDVDQLLDECLNVMRTEVRRMKVAQDAGKKLDGLQVNVLAKFAGTLQGIAMVRLNPFGDFTRLQKRVAEDADVVVAAKQKLLTKAERE